MLLHYETTDILRNILFSTAGETMKKYDDSLIVMDSLKGHFYIGNHMAFVNELVKRAKNGVLVVADAGPFFHLKKIDNLIEHELSMPSQFGVYLKRFCVLHKQDFVLTEEQRQKLVNHHGQVLVLEDR